MRDYAKKYSGGSGPRQKVAGKRGSEPEQRQAFKIMGVITGIALLLGVICSLWFGVALRDGLGKLDKGKQEKIEFEAANVALAGEKEALLKKEKIEAAAGGLGLFPPSETQTRRP